MNTMKMLVKREYWEHKGGMFWAPVIASIIFVVMSTLALIFSTYVNKNFHGSDNVDVSLRSLVRELSDPTKAADVGAGVQGIFQLLGSFPFFVVMFVIFFYCLSSMYDERKDKSILFWKSMPVSDEKTVLSKVFSALVVIPAIGIAVCIATAFVLFVIASIFTLVNGASPAILWNFGSIAKAIFNLTMLLPVYSLWALPTIGWLMLCSAWSRRVPFLWAVIVPILSGVMVWMLDLMSIFGQSAEWFWANIVGRILGGTFPASHYIYGINAGAIQAETNSPVEFSNAISIGNTYQVFTMPAMWIGIAAGAAMIYIAMRLRRYRDEG